MRRVLCSAATGPHVEFLEATKPVLAEYGRRHGYDVVTEFPLEAPPRVPRRVAESRLARRYDALLTRFLLAAMNRMPVSEKGLKRLPAVQRLARSIDSTAMLVLRTVAACGVAPTPPAWNKVVLVRRLLAEYDLVVWIDADAVLVDLSKDIADELQPDKWLYMVEHHFLHEGSHLNAGVFMVRAGRTADRFFREVAALTPFRHHRWWEQAAILYLLGYDFWPTRKARITRYSPGVALIDKRWNSIPPDQAEEPRIKHYPGLDNISRLELISRDVARVQAALQKSSCTS